MSNYEAAEILVENLMFKKIDGVMLGQNYRYTNLWEVLSVSTDEYD